MAIDFFLSKCQSQSNNKIFGLCDDPFPATNHAYIDESDGRKWIAVVENESRYLVIFTAIDKCIIINRADGRDDKRCDGMLTYTNSSRVDNVIFVELKERGAIGNNWVIDAEQQLRTSISYFEQTDSSNRYNEKKAYIANKEHPRFKASQSNRMETFERETGYVLRIVNRIKLD